MLSLTKGKLLTWNNHHRHLKNMLECLVNHRHERCVPETMNKTFKLTGLTVNSAHACSSCSEWLNAYVPNVHGTGLKDCLTWSYVASKLKTNTAKHLLPSAQHADETTRNKSCKPGSRAAKHALSRGGPTARLTCSAMDLPTGQCSTQRSTGTPVHLFLCLHQYTQFPLTSS